MNAPTTPPSFADELRAGRAAPADIDDHIERWHDLPDDDPDATTAIYDYLGLTWDEYRIMAYERPA
ncbi:hypothetical protein [Polymorphospora lycopeni]|uniref:Uncharacterized protein n=1 Tax=Polymorphospora lycopeni TaxID=3140240 RepID=A0ABV5CL16_9ACTN